MIVCGSALSIMTELLSGTKALRGARRSDIVLVDPDRLYRS